MPAPAYWDAGRVERLKKLYEAGMSANQIAAALGLTSRNAVLGKIHRLRLERRGRNVTVLVKRKVEKFKDKKEKAKTRSMFLQFGINVSKPEKASKILTLPVCVEAAPSRNLALTEILAGECHYPTSPEGSPLAFCGHPVRLNTSWCDAHYRVVFRPVAARQAKQQVAA